MSDSKDQVTTHTASVGVTTANSPAETSKQQTTVIPTVNPAVGDDEESVSEVAPADQLDQKKTGFLAYFKTKEFYIVLSLGQLLAIANTATSTFSTLLSQKGTSIPAFQTFFNYVLLNLIFTSYTLYRYGIKGWARMVYKHGWKYIILAFCDVEGNYFIVLAYRYTTMLSAQLINFWAIAVVVVVSFIFLRVRYHISQVLGILICIGGMGVLIASDHLTGTNGGNISSGDQLKGDLFALLGATCYGLANTGEEYFVSTRPVYEVLGQMAFFGMLINGAQAGIFDRASFRSAVWDSQVGGYLAGYTLCLTLFYTLAPLLFRLSSAAFFNISMLTMNFWGVCIGIKVFHYSIHWMYPIAFVCIIVGQLIYFLGRRLLGEARKPWLGQNQERGIAGVFTAKRRIDHTTTTITSTTSNSHRDLDDPRTTGTSGV
ncbi:putative membrane protein [Aspergillus taichungensis]|uniref:Putative membrane protein n=1 Tax=Aspergillus taichungensis TaxID=482145 RepID=A0A2J5HEA0_9EURO|nr:putative membrane protein [Aspergillus taichungensis]